MIEALTTMSAIGGLIAFILFVIVIPYCLADDGRGANNPLPAIAWLVIGAVVLFFTWDGFPRLSLVAWLILIPAYFAIGFLWFIWKWRQLILRKGAEADAAEARMATGSYPNMTREAVRNEFRPQASRHKDTIAGWIVLWPWSMSWTVLKWPWRLAVKLAEWARGIADRMVDKLWSN